LLHLQQICSKNSRSGCRPRTAEARRKGRERETVVQAASIRIVDPAPGYTSIAAILAARIAADD